jgi:zeaxanthin glucosyltransferase
MANIVIAPLYWQANMNVTFALAKKLRGRGHRVHYACIPETEERIRAQGFEFVPLFSGVFPQGTLATQFANEARGKYLGVPGVNARVRAMCELCRDGEVSKATGRLHPDLFLVSNHLPWAGIGAWKTGARVIMFSSVVVSAPDSVVPPISSDSIPSSNFSSRLKISWEWRKMMLRRRLVGRISGLAKTSGYLKDLAAAAGYPLSDIDFDVMPWPRLSFPELVFVPECFDFPRANPIQGLFHVEPSVDADRKDRDFPWEKLDARPLVYCSLGSLITFKYLEQAKRFFQALMDAMRERPGLQAAIAIGSYLKPADFQCPENVILTDEAPQVALLKQAALMVGHAGGGCVRESIFYGVPMLLLPVGFDAPGNAARACAHGTALRADFQKASARDLQIAIDKLLDDPSYAAAARRMSRKFVELQEQAPSIPIIENALAGRPNVRQSA